MQVQQKYKNTYSPNLVTDIGNCAPNSNFPLINGLVAIALNLSISIPSTSPKAKWGNKVAMKTFISNMLNLDPGQECGPKEKVIRFIRPGWAGERADGGRSVQRSGLVERLSIC